MYIMASQVVLPEGWGGRHCGTGWGEVEGTAPYSSWATEPGVACKTAAVDQQNLNLSQGKSYGKAESGGAT